MNAEQVLSAYSLEEILEFNDMTEEELLQRLMDDKIVKLPEYEPLDFDE